jgi:DNA polymerase-3 subunit delta
MTVQELTKHLAADRIEPLYFVSGEESWLAEQALTAFRRHATSADDLMNTHLFSGSAVDPSEIVAVAQTLPAFAPRRLIIVRDAERLAASDALTTYCKDPSPSTCLVMVMAKPDRRKSWIHALLDRAVTVSCDPLKPPAVKTWLAREAASRDLSMTDEAVAYLLARADGSLRTLAQDLDKLALSRPQGQPTPAGMADLIALSPGRAAISVFDWADAVAARRSSDAVAYAEALLTHEPPLLLLSILAGQWRKMIRYRTLVDRGTPPSMALQALGLPPPAANRVSKGAEQRTLPALIGGLTWCMETDAAIKGGALSPDLAIERLVLMLCEDSPPSSDRAVTKPWWPGLSARCEAVGVAGQARNQS